MINGLKVFEAVTSGNNMIINLKCGEYDIISNGSTEVKYIDSHECQIVLPKDATIRTIHRPTKVFAGYHIEELPGSVVSIENYEKRCHILNIAFKI